MTRAPHWLLTFALLVSCGASEVRTRPSRDVRSDAGLAEVDAGTGGGTAGGGAATGGGGTGGGGGGGVTGGGATGGGGGTSCSPATCAGCCANGACVGGTANAQCGFGGVACNACPTGDACNAGFCEIAPGSMWHVMATNATVQDVWDATSLPDVELGLYCPADAPDITDVMAKVQDSTMPTWTTGGCTLTASQLTTIGFDFDAVDVDGIAYDTIVGRTHVPVTSVHLRAGSLTGAVGSDIAVTFSFTRQ